MRFLVDENLPASVSQGLTRSGHDVLDIGDSAYRGSADTLLWQLAVDEARVLVTCDRDFPIRGTSARPPGLVLVRPARGMRTAEIALLFETALTSVGLPSLLGQITVIEPGRVRQRSYRTTPK